MRVRSEPKPMPRARESGLRAMSAYGSGRRGEGEEKLRRMGEEGGLWYISHNAIRTFCFSNPHQKLACAL